MKHKIPKIIHQVWLGDPSKMPKVLMDTWRMDGWTYVLWTEDNIPELINKHIFDYYYDRGIYSGASDVLRLEILEIVGGVYIDADTERLQSLDNAPFMDAQFFAVEANSPSGVPVGQNRVANGIMGAVPNHLIIRQYIKEMGRATKLIPAWSTIGGTLLTECIYNFMSNSRPAGKNGVQILPPHTFYPLDSKGRPSRTQGFTYARHLWGSKNPKIYSH